MGGLLVAKCPDLDTLLSEQCLAVAVLLRWVGHFAALDLRSARQHVCAQVAGRHNVLHTDAVRQQIVADQSAMTSPEQAL